MFLLGLLILATAVFVEGVTELICKSRIFSSFRLWLSSRHPFLKELIQCGYCTSVYISFLSTIPWSIYICMLYSYWLFPLAVLLGTVFFHRLSNYLHNANDKYLDKFYDNRLRGG